MFGKKRGWVIVFAYLFLLPVFSLSGYVVKTGPTEVQSLYYTFGSQSGTDAYYQDAMGNNPDVGLMICDSSLPPSYYVGLVYRINTEGSSPLHLLVSYGKSTSNLPQASISTSYSGMQCKRTDIGDFVVSPSYYDTRDPKVYVSGFPGKTWIMYSSSPTGDNPSFVLTSCELEGSYSCSLDYTYSTNTISMQSLSVIVNTGAGQSSITLNDPYRGISTERPILLGICSDDEGKVCNTAAEKVTDSSFPKSYTLDVSPDDSKVYYRYGVVNGLKCGEICIGADLQVSIDVSLNPIYYSQDQEVTYTITNNGNVPVTSQFSIEITIENETGQIFASDIRSYSGLEESGGSVSGSFTWNALAHSGTYYAKVKVDIYNSIAECNENNNEAQKQFELKPVYIPDFYVNGEYKNTTKIFPYPGRPYDVLIHMHNSDGNVVKNATIFLTEENGLLLFSPTQIWEAKINNSTVKTGTKTKSIVELKTDDNGNVSLTLIPTWNPLYKQEYNYLDLNPYIGNYSLYLSGYDGGDNFKFVINGTLTDKYYLEFENYNYTDANLKKKTYLHFDKYVLQVMDYIYSIFAIFWKSVI